MILNASIILQIANLWPYLRYYGVLLVLDIIATQNFKINYIIRNCNHFEFAETQRFTLSRVHLRIS